jgi:FSR family fosmidomycin resistance protein-like MFS transporter
MAEAGLARTAKIERPELIGGESPPLRATEGLIAAAPSVDIRAGGLAVLAFGHTTADFYATYLTPLLPLLADRFKLSTFLCSALVAAVGISGSTIQPLLGALGGRAKGKAPIVLGMFMMAVFFSCLGLAPNLFALFALLIAGGLGCSLFHPHAAALATRIGVERRGLAMSVFTVAGTAGIFLSPKIVPRIASHWGLEALIVTMPLGLVCAGLLLFWPLPSGEAAASKRTEWRGLVSGNVRGLAFLVVAAILHTITVTGFCTFLPLLLCRQRNFTLTAAGDLLAWFILSGALGVLIGGYVSDRIGRWWTILFSYAAVVPLLSGFLAMEGLSAQLALLAAGVALWAALPCTITLAQELVPQAAGIASGLVMGFSWGMGSLVLPIFGMIADRAGTAYAMRWIALLPLGAAVTLCLMKRFASAATVAIKPQNQTEKH